MADKVQIPAAAVAGDDIAVPTETLLCTLNLLPPSRDLETASKAQAVISGPPASVALIEAGATAANKWWAAGLGGSAAVTWTAVIGWWSGAGEGNQRVILWAAAIVTAAAVLGIAYLLGSDVRGRAAVAAETVRARASVAEAFVRTAEQARSPVPAAGVPPTDTTRPADQVTGLPALSVEKAATSEGGWYAIALSSNGKDRTRYLIVKGTAHEWVDADTVRII